MNCVWGLFDARRTANLITCPARRPSSWFCLCWILYWICVLNFHGRGILTWLCEAATTNWQENSISTHQTTRIKILRWAAVWCSRWLQEVSKSTVQLRSGKLWAEVLTYKPTSSSTSTGPYRSCAAHLSRSISILSCELACKFFCGLVSLYVDGCDKQKKKIFDDM